MAALTGRAAGLKWLDTSTTSSYATPALTMTAVVANRIYRLPTAAAQKYLDENSAMTVTANGASKTKGVDYDVVGPCIVFRASATEPILISNFKYYTVIDGPDAKSWTLDVTLDTEEITDFKTGDDQGWVSSVPITSDAKVSIGKWLNDGHILTNHTTGTFVLVLYTVTASNKRFECYATFSGESLKVDANGIPSEDINFNVSGRVYYFDS